jgi:pRiA4b ORF-3-like protein
MPSKTKQAPQLGGLAYQFKISLVDVEPPIWRRILVTDSTNLRTLHLIIQEAMGWQSCHLFEFEVDEIRYGEDLDDDFDDGEARPAKSVRIGDLGLGEGDAFIYLYDFGDNWVHEVRIESVSPVERGAAYPRCLGGERRCPPEDCGGVPGYQSILSALRSPSNLSGATGSNRWAPTSTRNPSTWLKQTPACARSTRLGLAAASGLVFRNPVQATPR